MLAITAGCSQMLVPSDWQKPGYQVKESRYSKSGDHDGTAAEMLELSDGKNGEKSKYWADTSGNTENLNTDVADYRRNFTIKGHDFYQRDVNYHGHLNDRSQKPSTSSYYLAYDGRLAERLSNEAARIENVQDARVLVRDQDILVALMLKDTRLESETREKTADRLRTHTNGKTLKVTTDPATFYYVRGLDNDLRKGMALPIK